MFFYTLYKRPLTPPRGVRYAKSLSIRYFIDIDILQNSLIDIDIDIFKNVLIDIDTDIDIFKNSLIDIDIFKKCRYIDMAYRYIEHPY